jgi:hypothetical protein
VTAGRVNLPKPSRNLHPRFRAFLTANGNLHRSFSGTGHQDARSAALRRVVPRTPPRSPEFMRGRQSDEREVAIT